MTVVAVSAGTATVTVTATDPGGASATQSFQVTVPNRAPEPRGSIPALTVEAGGEEAVDLGPYFTDPDGDALTYLAFSSASSVARVSVSASTVTVVAVSAGAATVTATAADPHGATATQSFEVTVPNRAPEPRGSIPALTVEAGEEEAVDLEPYFTDPDEDALEYSASSSSARVAAVSVSGKRLTVRAGRKGTATVTAMATDQDGASATQTFRVTVPNRAPEPRGSMPAVTVAAGRTATVDLEPYFTDPDGDALEYAASSSAAAVATASVSGRLVTVSGVARGSATVMVTATDAEGRSATQSFTVTVPNRAPVPAGTIPRQTLEEGGTGTLALATYFTDPDGDALDYSAVSSNTTVATVVGVTGATLTIRAVRSGTATVTVTARDPGRLTATQTFTVAVETGNQAPQPRGALTDRTVVEGSGVTVNLANAFTDPDGDALEYSAVSSITAVARVAVTGATLRVSGVAPGRATVTVTARDPGNLEATRAFGVTVTAAGAPDLVFSRVDPEAATAAAGTDVTVEFTIRNAGDRASPATGSKAYQSSDQTITTADRVIIDAIPVAALAPAATTTLRLPFGLPQQAPPGTVFYVGMCVDPVTGEQDTANNCSTAVTLTVASGVTRLTNNPGADGEPAWSPDGRKIAFVSDRDGNYDIYVMNADGSGVTQLTNDAIAARDPDWSPDATKVVFASVRDGNSEIYVMNADGSGAVNLTNHSADDSDPAWSPDGSRIAFSSVRDGNWEVYVMNADGTGVTNLTNHSAGDLHPAWSPDGTRVSFRTSRDGNSEIYVMNADGSGAVNLTNHSAQERNPPTWSPDGTKIAFDSDRDGNFELYVMNADGTGVTNLTNHSAHDAAPSWSPDGSRIAFVSLRDGNEEIYVMSVPASGNAAASQTGPKPGEADPKMTVRASLIPLGPARD